MESTAKKQCNILVDVLIAHGIRHFVMSPGSRNAPIIVALARRDGIERHVVVDERSAAFIALDSSNRQASQWLWSARRGQHCSIMLLRLRKLIIRNCR